MCRKISVGSFLAAWIRRAGSTTALRAFQQTHGEPHYHFSKTGVVEPCLQIIMAEVVCQWDQGV